ncbi:MAG: hypothetical protein DIZ80_02480 [endosymbiont of Galathealinum brachiosum]|uniref:Uncharacterized protein n=1 Tax=endosymbiont of Galathealinum brachiosum TaxID=2200906 RepID=A0A370DKB7_9GAMM|nr:MAG: hypothetical protein DIZ80_02480 [endosymbiont of Galathealinum brachiosum]
MSHIRNDADANYLLSTSKKSIHGVKMKKIFLIISTLLLTLNTTPTYSEINLYITTGFTPPVSDFYASVLTEADKRLDNISIRFETLPAERSLVLANQGLNDGECCRIPAVIASEYNNLLPINESFFSARFSAFTKHNNSHIEKFEDLKPFSVGTVAGWKIAVIRIKDVNPAETHIVTTPEQMFNMLELERIDFGVMGYLSGLKSISSLKLDKITAIEPPLVERQLYLMLHNKHKELIPVFDKIFRQMNDDGTIEKLYNDLIKKLRQ